MASVYPVTLKNKAGVERTVYRVQYTNANGKLKQKQFRNKRLANSWISAGGHVAVEAAPIEATGSKFSAIAKAWVSACERGLHGEMPLEVSVTEGYRSYLKNWINPEIGDLDIADVDRNRFREFRDWVLEQGLARATAKKIVGIARSVIKYALDTDLIPADPTTGITVKLASGRHRDRSTKRLPVHSKADMKKLLAVSAELAKAEDKRTSIAWARYRPMLLLFVYAGLRSSELRGLPRDMFDHAEGSVEVKQRADRYGVIGPPKSTAGYRIIRLPRWVADEVAEYLKTHDHELVFPARRSGEPMSRENIERRMWTPLQKKVGVSVLGLHSIRHFFASRLIELGANSKQLQERMGHHSESFTKDVYGHLFKDEENIRADQQLAERLTL